MNDLELRQIVGKELKQSMGYYSGDLSSDRENAMDSYLSNPYGNEEKGRSKFVDSSTLETIEWMLPTLLKIFFASGDAVKFSPVSPEDEDVAKQETQVINHVMTTQNNIFMVFYTWFKDALMQKNGIVKYYWDDKETTAEEVYEGLTLEQVVMLEQDEDAEITEATPRQEMIDGGDGQPQPMEVYDVRVVHRESEGQVKIESVAPENFYVHPQTVNLNDTKFCAEKILMTRSDLIEAGYNKEMVNSLPSTEADVTDNTETYTRQNLSDEQIQGGVEAAGQAMEEIEVYECYIKVDFDGDGIAERRRVLYVEADNGILDNEPFEFIQYCSVSPTMLSHKFYGLSIYDVVGDLQKLKTILTRNIIDNIYLINNQRIEVEEGNANIRDVLDNRPGSVVRSKRLGGVKPIPTTPLGGDVYNFIEMVDGWKENRTGVTKYNQGLDANSLNKTASGISQIMSASQQRLELIARTFAETGVKDLALGIHRLIRQNQSVEMAIRLSNNWVNVNPEDWKERFDMDIEVGLGTGNKDQMLNQYVNLWESQMQAFQMQLGIVDESSLYATAMKMAENAGITVPERHWIDPDQPNPQQQDQQQGQGQQQPDPAQEQMQQQIQMQQQQIQIQQQEFQAEMQLKQQEFQAEMQLKQAMLQGEQQLKQAELQETMALKSQQIQGDLAIKKEKVEGELHIKGQSAMAKASNDMEKITDKEKSNDMEKMNENEYAER